MVAKHTERGASGRRVREPFSFAGTILSFQVAERLPKGQTLIGSGVKTHCHAGGRRSGQYSSEERCRSRAAVSDVTLQRSLAG